MKKFAFMLLATFIAMASWAQQSSVKNRQLLPEQFAAKTATTIKQVSSMKQMAPRQAIRGKVQAPAKNVTPTKAKSSRKKALDPTALLSGDPVTFIVKSNAYEMENQGTDEDPNYQLVPLKVSKAADVWTVTVDPKTLAVSITGISGGETEVKGTIDAESMTVTIPYGQAVGTTQYGTIGLTSATGAENLVGTFTGEAIEFNDYWYISLIDGSYAGSTWSDIYGESQAVPSNGKMTWGENEAYVFIDFNEKTFIATVWNFGGRGVAIDITLKNGGMFVIESQLAVVSSNGEFYTYNADCTTPEITGTGTENTLTTGSSWTFYAASSGYWSGEQAAGTITYDGTFIYPELEEVPAIPAAPTISFFEFWNGESATVTLNVPVADVDGNDIKPTLLSYQLFTTAEDGGFVSLGEPIAYNDEGNGTGAVKTVILGKEAKDLTVICAKSIYTAAGVTNESELTRFIIPQIVTVPDGLELKEYPATADAYSGSWTTYNSTVKVGIDGTDVYIQGIMPQAPNGWVKGTIKDGVVTFPIQCIGTYNNSVYLYLSSYDNDNKALVPAVFTYDADEDIYSTDAFLFANASSESLGFYYPYFSGMIIGTEKIPDLVELPEGATFVQYPFVGTTYSSSGSEEFESTVNVAVVDNDVYIQGLNNYNKTTWVKGTKDEKTGDIIFPTGQNLGTFEYSGTTYQFFMVGYDGSNITDVVMTYDEEQDFYLLQTGLVVNGKKSSLNYYEWYEAGSTIGIQKKFEATFNFNTMELATSSAVTSDGDITETKTFTDSKYGTTLAISPKDEAATTANRFWDTKNGPQLRVYSGTLTFTAPEGYVITSLVFNSAKWNEGNTADGGEFDGTTWTGEAKTVVVTIAGNSQINSIDVILEREGVNITVGNALYATFWTDIDVDFTYSGLTAYAAQLKDTYVHLEPVTVVPSYTAVVVKAETPGTYRAFKYDNADARPELGTANDLLPAQKDVIADGTQYILARDEESETMEVGFYQAIPETTIAMGKAYIVIDSPVKAFYGFTDDDATGISEVESSKLKVEGPIYNLAGQRVSKMQKGINIIGGKKVLK
ncbi:MAG: hypothetical protein J6I86_00120 [Bacteroidaceae bacterium]|nr:hypothetical protein [Bacteroidaceae bacterium]